ncbi:MAG: DUF6144 family protein [Candidatus Hermodarchaeota archaeon]
MKKESDNYQFALNMTKELLNSLIQGLEKTEIDLETRKEIMEYCGQACAKLYGHLDIAEKIAEEASTVQEILSQFNAVPWCGKWYKKGDTIQAECSRCGCPLVQNNIISLSETLCLCSRGWVGAVFEKLFKKPVEVELASSIGKKDKICQFVVRFP